MVQEERSIATGEVLGMRGGRASSVDMSQKGSMLSAEKSTAEEVGVQGMQGGEPHHKKLQ